MAKRFSSHLGAALSILLHLLMMVGCSAGDAASTSTTGSIASTSQAITNGEDDDDDSAVVALLSNGEVYCSGTLITPYLIVTAAHCLSPVPPDQVFFGSDPQGKGRRHGTFEEVGSTRVHPEFDEATLTHDIGVVGLKKKANVKPMTILDGSFDESFKDREIRLVGFGAAKAGDTTTLRKRTGETKIESFTDTEFRFRPGPSQTCNGDSGGAAIINVDGHDVLIGVTSAGDPDCKVYGKDARLDAYGDFVTDNAVAYAARHTDPLSSQGCSTARHPSPSRPQLTHVLVLAAAVAAVLRRAFGRTIID